MTQHILGITTCQAHVRGHGRRWTDAFSPHSASSQSHYFSWFWAMAESTSCRRTVERMMCYRWMSTQMVVDQCVHQHLRRHRHSYNIKFFGIVVIITPWCSRSCPSSPSPPSSPAFVSRYPVCCTHTLCDVLGIHSIQDTYVHRPGHVYDLTTWALLDCAAAGTHWNTCSVVYSWRQKKGHDQKKCFWKVGH